MNSHRDILKSSAASPLETVPCRYNSRTINSRAACYTGWFNWCNREASSSSKSILTVFIVTLSFETGSTDVRTAHPTPTVYQCHVVRFLAQQWYPPTTISTVEEEPFLWRMCGGQVFPSM